MTKVDKKELVALLTDVLESKNIEAQNKLLNDVFTKYGYKQIDFAKHMNISRQSVNRYFKLQDFSYFVFFNLVDFLGLKVKITSK